MWKLLKILGRLLRALCWLLLLLAIGAAAVLYVLENGLPACAVSRISERLSDEEVMVEIDRITFTPGGGVNLHDVRAAPRKLAGESFGSVEKINIRLALSPFIEHSARIRSVTLRGVEMPRHPRRIFRKLRELERETKPEQPRRRLPHLEPFRLTVENSCVIALRTSRTTATVGMHDPLIRFSDITLHWPERTPPMSLSGGLEVNLATEVLSGTVAGEAFPDDLEGFLAELGARTAIREMNRFTELPKPSAAECDFSASIKTGEFMLNLDLAIGACRYRGVPLDYAAGNIRAWETNHITRVKITGFSAANASGKLEGDLLYDEENESVTLRAASTMDHNDALAMIHILTHGELEPLQPESPPVVSAEGIVAVSTNSTVRHDLTGRVRMREGVVFGLIVSEASADYHVQGDRAYLNDVRGATPAGGAVSGKAEFAIPDSSGLPPSVTAQVKLDRVDLSDIARVFSVTNTKAGECFGDMRLSGVMGTNQLHTVNGSGHFRISQSRIIRLKFFAGLTDYISNNVPGISSIVDQSDFSMDFTIQDGVLASDNFLVEGSVFSIQGKGTYDLAQDNFDMRVHVALFRQKSFAGRISRLVTFPFKKLLLEFRVFGSLDDPQWSYVSILERITDQLPDMKEQ
jgi:hypothetical protein